MWVEPFTDSRRHQAEPPRSASWQRRLAGDFVEASAEPVWIEPDSRQHLEEPPRSASWRGSLAGDFVEARWSRCGSSHHLILVDISKNLPDLHPGLDSLAGSFVEASAEPVWVEPSIDSRRHLKGPPRSASWP